MKLSLGDRVVSIAIIIIMALLSAAFLLPFLLVVGSSLLTPGEYAARGMAFLPRHPTLDTYKILLVGREIWIAYGVSALRTLLGTVMNIVVSAMLAYGISKKDLPGRNIFITLLFITMIFNGGLIPNYIIVSNLKLTDTIWCMLLPNLVNVWNVFVLRNFFNPSMELACARVPKMIVSKSDRETDFMCLRSTAVQLSLFARSTAYFCVNPVLLLYIISIFGFIDLLLIF